MRPLPHETVVTIRKYHAAGYRVADIARAFGLRRETVSNIVGGGTHKHVR